MSASSTKANDESWHKYRFANASIPRARWEMAFGRASNDEPIKMTENFVCEGCGETKPVIEKSVKAGKCINCTYY